METWKKPILTGTLKILQGTIDTILKEESWDSIGNLVQPLGRTAQAAFRAGDVETGRQVSRWVMDLADKVIEASESERFLPVLWNKQRTGWYVATCLGYIAQEAARCNLEDIAREAFDRLEKLRLAAQKANGRETEEQVIIHMAYLMAALYGMTEG